MSFSLLDTFAIIVDIQFHMFKKYYNPGDRVQCKATHFPKASIHWIDDTGNNSRNATIEGNVIHIVETMLDRWHWYTCIAEGPMGQINGTLMFKVVRKSTLLGMDFCYTSHEKTIMCLVVFYFHYLLSNT